MASRTIVCVSFAVLAFFVSYGWSLKCYSCQHDGILTNNTECQDEFKEKQKYNVSCLTNTDFVCGKVTGKITIKDRSSEAIVRGCFEKKLDCSKIKEGIEQGLKPLEGSIKFSHCSTCEKDLCNSSINLKSSFTLYLAIFVSYLFATKLMQ